MVRVLIVDDEIELTNHIAEYLGSFEGEFEVARGYSGEEGLRILADRPFDLLLTDIRLPGIDGLELVHKALRLIPELRVIVMTAFGSDEMRQVVGRAGAIDFIEKPLDLEDLRLTLHETIQADRGRIGGLDVLEVVQFLAIGAYTRVVRVQSGKEKGTLVFEAGELTHVATRRLKGERAFHVIAGWNDASFQELPAVDIRRYQKNVQRPTKQVIAEEIELRTESAPATGGGERARSRTTSDGAGIVTNTTDAAPPATPTGAIRTRRTEEINMAIRDHLTEFQSIEGFLGAAVFSSQGEMLESFTNTKMDIKSVGMFANNALLNAQKATDQMGVGRGNLMQVRAPQATVVMRCLNEATDFSATSTGKAHFHTVVVMAPEGNVGMATMILDKVVGKIAEEVR
jgi:DNA-binding response OmpR family regulator/predicted regulator of Ras-like GTPase activity (Roadblock/LC7/MglB family)